VSSSFDSSILDPLHAAAVDAACAADAARIAAGEWQFVRLAHEHEFCQGAACWRWPILVRVTGYTPGIRTREPIAATVVAA
jgi:hypothetical protein